MPETLNELQVEQLLESVDAKAPLGLRDRAMLELLYASGLRISELAGAKLENLDLEIRRSCASREKETRRGSCRWAAKHAPRSQNYLDAGTAPTR